MKSLVPWVLLMASASSPLFAEDKYNDYRLGNYNKAAEPLISQAEKDAVSNYYLGRLYLYGYGQLRNNVLAMRYFTKSAEQNYLPSLQLMARYALLHDKNPEQAIVWFKKAAAAGDVNAQLFMAAAYMYGIGVSRNEDAATRYYIDAAKNGNAIAQFALANNFMDSRHSTNNKLGLIWLTKSATNGNPKALTQLGSLYLSGKLVTKDEAKGVELLTKAASQNFAPAMIELGNLALLQNDQSKALEWYNNAAKLNEPNSYLQLAHVYLQEKSPIFDPKAGFFWTSKAAQNDIPGSKMELAQLYQKGIGVPADVNLAKQWSDQAAQEDKKKNSGLTLTQAALWLSNGTTEKMEATAFQIPGIFSAWNNTTALRNDTYNQAPQLEVISRQKIFKPEFQLTQPNDVPLNTYYDALVSKNFEFHANQWTYPSYQITPEVEALERATNYVVAKNNLPAPHVDASYYSDEDMSSTDLKDRWTQGWQQQVNFVSLFNHLYFRAILGDADSQFEIGQMFQYGIGAQKNDAAAIAFYQNSAEQQNLKAGYYLGILYLKTAKTKEEYQTALNWLTDMAFKGNKKAQYVLSYILEQGVQGPDGTPYIQSNPEQARSMLYLSASNNYGPAEYDLAEHLAREYNNGLSVEVKQHKIALIRKLYEGAAKNGVAQALIPLAFYNAMDSDIKKQAQAFKVAEEQANLGDDKAALLLGMLFDRGIGISADPAKALFWYQKSGHNPVSQFILGTYTTEGKGVVADKEKGMNMLKNSADAEFAYADFNLAAIKQQNKEDFLPYLVNAYKLGNSHAGIVLADYYLAENKNEENVNQAKEIYTGLAEKGDQYAQLKLGYMMDNGLGAVPDKLAAQRWYTASAEQGNAQAQYLLGQFYQIGALGEPDYTLAKFWYQKAAQQLPMASVALGFLAETVDDNYTDALKFYEQAVAKGDALGFYNLGLMYEYGKGLPVDYAKAKGFFSDAANKGIAEAMNQLGGMYFYGLGQPRNVQEALSWFKKAGDLGNANALYELGLLSETGVATKIDFPNAIKFYQAASDLGNDKAQLALARMYHYGLGVEKNHKVSADIYQKLADKQNAYAQYQLGLYYLEGTAGERLPEKARLLLKQASENGSLQARKALEKLDAQTPLQPQTQAKVSYIEPILLNKAPSLKGQSADLMYLSALNEWNRGNEELSRMMLQRLVALYPNFIPAKRIMEQLNQAPSLT